MKKIIILVISIGCLFVLVSILKFSSQYLKEYETIHFLNNEFDINSPKDQIIKKYNLKFINKDADISVKEHWGLSKKVKIDLDGKIVENDYFWVRYIEFLGDTAVITSIDLMDKQAKDKIEEKLNKFLGKPKKNQWYTAWKIKIKDQKYNILIRPSGNEDEYDWAGYVLTFTNSGFQQKFYKKNAK